MAGMTINGSTVEAKSTFGVINPATGLVAAEAPLCTPEQLNDAVAAAAAAGTVWRADDEGRQRLLLTLADAIIDAQQELATTLTLESGKPASVAAFEPVVCATWLRVVAGMRIPREVLQDDAAARIEVVRRPLGVVSAITPWNFPLATAIWKIAPALRAGNTVVLKPSPFTPLSTLLLGEIINRLLPAGVVNVITGGDQLGRALIGHPVPRKVSFTGSTEAGKDIARAAGADLKRLTLELGGNDAAILLPDVDLSTAVPHLSALSFFNSGQACALPKRIYVSDDRYDEAVEAFVAAAAGIKVGPPDDQSVGMGPLSTAPQFERVRELTAKAVADGAKAATGGKAIGGAGYLYEPTILTDVREGMAVVDEEQFGPVLPILRYGDVDDAVRRANDTTFGLCGSVWGSDLDIAQTVAERLECGNAFVNTHGALLPHIPYGGSKWSGIGVENGQEGLLAFTEPQVVHIARG
ncbi:aldehyde dehydrogenase family protein [Actinoplanes sp. M2I2]|uniref:aldehyde dehydrogenase family protein n=1 Tax=Actinoplanes sp. M2I2 TaxID=1734444 RepID=UPI002022617C|nr:aldehyde dehydrogenase family protein [Actinoplanes sp. M2I2]